MNAMAGTGRQPGSRLGIALVLILGAFLEFPPLLAQQAEGVSTRSAGHDPAYDELVEQAAGEFSRGDVVAAMVLLRKPAEAGHVPAQMQLAYYLDYAEEDAAALRWYLAAAEAGAAEAQFYLGKMYIAGEGAPADRTRALDWIERAAEQGYPGAIRALVMSFEQGGELTDIDYDRAVDWLQSGVDSNDVWSMRRMSEAYRRGELGLRIDRERAAQLASLADALNTQIE